MAEGKNLQATFQKLAGFLLKFREPDFTMLLEKCDSQVPGFSSRITVQDLRYVKSILTDQHSADDVTRALMGALRSGRFDRSDFDVVLRKNHAQGSKRHEETERTDISRGQNMTSLSRPRARISDYIILSEKLEGNLMGRVNVLLKEGWEPIGGVSFAALGASPIGGNRFIQAMIKFRD